MHPTRRPDGKGRLQAGGSEEQLRVPPGISGRQADGRDKARDIKDERESAAFVATCATVHGSAGLLQARETLHRATRLDHSPIAPHRAYNYICIALVTGIRLLDRWVKNKWRVICDFRSDFKYLSP